MALEELRIIHATHPGVWSGDSPISSPGAFHLSTCQRVLWIFLAGDLDESALDEKFSVHSGADAYALLLRVACGLESQVIGETDIFGQLKEAWKKSSSELDSEIDLWIRRVFEDTKEIRSRYLEHLGGVSYGTLIRKFLKTRVLKEPTLLLGAGQLAQSVAPFLVEQELWIWNRSVSKAHSLAERLEQDFGARVRVLETEQDEAEGWSKAAQAIVCIPPDAERDPVRAKLWQGQTILHLGAQRAQCGVWKDLKESYFLDDLFELQKTQGEVRSMKIGHALRACDERAKLRTLGPSVSIHHGWEDLAVFA